MAFSIYCVGNNDFHYSIGHVSTIGDVFEIEEAMSRISGGITDPVGTLRDEIQGAVVPQDDYLQDSMTVLGQAAGMHILDVGFTAAMPRMQSLRISISARNPGWVISESGYAEEVFYAGDPDIVRIFMVAFAPLLEQTGLNGDGVLRTIGQALSEYAGHRAARLPESGRGFSTGARYLLNINLVVL